ncbi:hypothetical protein G6F65_019278 [Rhizopus arrhizus]|nr:hypothetical protein G6F65_019278 [Rhizopus arrhizus]
MVRNTSTKPRLSNTSVALPVLQVDFLVRDVPVAADDELAAGGLVLVHQGVDPGAEAVQETVLGLLPFVAAGPRGQVGADHRQVLPVGADDTAFGVEFLAVQSDVHAFGGVAQVDAHAAVALLDRVVEVAGIAGRVAQVIGQVRVGDHDFLKAKDVCGMLVHPGLQALAEGGTDAVEIDGRDAQQSETPVERPWGPEQCQEFNRLGGGAGQ